MNWTSLLWPFVLAVVILYLVYGSEDVNKLFHKRRVRIYFGRTHPSRHHRNRRVRHTNSITTTISSTATPASALTSSGTTSSPPNGSGTTSSIAQPSLPNVYEVYTVDYRQTSTASNTPHVRIDGALRIVSWNIELGYNIDAIIARLQTLMPIDVLLLQEVDIIVDNGSATSAVPLHVDCVDAIASALHMMAVFTGSFAYRFGDHGGQGIWGSAVLSPWPLTNARAIRVPTLVDNYPKPTTVATAHHPTIGKLLCYSIHLEACSGIIGRIKQFSVVLDDWYQQHAISQPAAVIFAGDFNTLGLFVWVFLPCLFLFNSYVYLVFIGQGMARISPVHCRDALRWRTLFETEPQWWQKRLFDRPGQPAYGFHDPFDKAHRRHYSLINTLSQSKYDWILTNGLRSIHHDIGNTTESDHWFVLSDVIVSPYVPPPTPSLDHLNARILHHSVHHQPPPHHHQHNQAASSSSSHTGHNGKQQ
jgi:endonuclease/exonuclease/phosphatase family metal-dependent hydrolase